MVEVINLVLCTQIGHISHNTRIKFDVGTLIGSRVMANYVKNTYTPTDGKQVGYNIQGVPKVKSQTLGNDCLGQNKEKIYNKFFYKNAPFTRIDIRHFEFFTK
jgi:hypothetical protein